MKHKCPSPTGFFKVDNLFAELLTDYQKNVARNNLGIPQDSNLYWGNIKGYIEELTDVKSFITKMAKLETKKQIAELMEVSEETIDFVRNVAEWVLLDESGAAALALAVSLNKDAILEIKSNTVYLTQDEYDKLILDGLISDNTEYNIYEPDENI